MPRTVPGPRDCFCSRRTYHAPRSFCGGIFLQLERGRRLPPRIRLHPLIFCSRTRLNLNPALSPSRYFRYRLSSSHTCNSIWRSLLTWSRTQHTVLRPSPRSKVLHVESECVAAIRHPERLICDLASCLRQSRLSSSLCLLLIFVACERAEADRIFFDHGMRSNTVAQYCRKVEQPAWLQGCVGPEAISLRVHLLSSPKRQNAVEIGVANALLEDHRVRLLPKANASSFVPQADRQRYVGLSVARVD